MAWGWNPDSFAAIGTVAASFAALIALLISLRQWGASRYESSASHANLVAVSLKPLPPPKTNKNWTAWSLSIQNLGPLPIKPAALFVLVSEDVGLGQLDNWDLIGKGKAYLRRAMPGELTQYINESVAGLNVRKQFASRWGNRVFITAESESWPVQIPSGKTSAIEVKLRRTVDVASPQGHHVGLSFTDAQNAIWTRRIDGLLNRGLGLTRAAARRSETIKKDEVHPWRTLVRGFVFEFLPWIVIPLVLVYLLYR